MSTTCPECGFTDTCTCWWWESLRPGGQNEHLRERAITAMNTGVHEHNCPCPDCVAARDLGWLGGGLSTTIPVDAAREARWPR